MVNWNINWQAAKGDWRRAESFVKGFVSEQVYTTLYSCRKGIEKELNLHERGNFVVDSSYDIGRIVGGCSDALIFSAGLAEIACNFKGEEGPPLGEVAAYILVGKIATNLLCSAVRRYFFKDKRVR